ncbi:DUF1801 domain-containing protein [Actinoalloteichus caeruleus]|uniref:Uncharacterized conserved protein YdhG, YjbR/CyaY-like superfamily, DUF1801 family n=1 Tax=Actinoalloteichus caeruleus DSM 43889 TaxID=1120930 RepID=A0ABT1JK07_ACTCY|nr:DUF1801 domain-containing protein [Actinoalloteichus caeruleus]MCP2332847.1 Uncharacterized conserved protein YdhG, YjbR/CyaY-like superfamily, DUF1801 family [Actinoalloteichus caeruleus DSM 43889]
MSSTSHGEAGSNSGGFSEQERAAMRERAQELRKEAGRGRGGKAAADEADVLAKIGEMPEPDRSSAERVHAIVTSHAPDLAPKLWYGQPAYARKGKVVCFFRSGAADKERYSTFGFTPEARLDDDGGLWPTSYAVSELGDRAAETIAALVARAVG